MGEGLSQGRARKALHGLGPGGALPLLFQGHFRYTAGQTQGSALALFKIRSAQERKVGETTKTDQIPDGKASRGLSAVEQRLCAWKCALEKALGRELVRTDVALAWWRASRPAFYVATLVPLFLGFVQAYKTTGRWQFGLFLVILTACFFLHLAANLANDYYDYVGGVDGEGTIGGSRGLQKGLITLRQYRVTLSALFGGTVLLALAGVLYTGLWGIWLIIGFALFSSYCYVAPPIRYGYRALGEVFVFLSMGLCMTAGSYYTLTGLVSPAMVALSVPVGLMVAGILYFQSMPEIYTDAASGKRTLANLLGPERARVLYRFWWPFIFILILALWLGNVTAWPALLGAALSIPLHKKACAHVDTALISDQWLPLDAHGHLVRKMYLLCGVGLVAGVALN